jgi:error-prone DNA polymerase
MRRNNYKPEFIEKICKQIYGFSDYGFPESHSASFAQLAYFSAWFKCHHPAAFLAALLNSQPMGFYSPSQLIQDARRHGVEVRSADVSLSQWDCTMEGDAVRLGLRMVKGLGAGAGKRIAASATHATHAPHAAPADLARRAGLDARELKALAAAGARRSLAGHRRNARWAAAGVEKGTPLLPPEISQETRVGFAPASEGEDIVADYASLGFTLGRHPLALLRDPLRKLGVMTAGELNASRAGRRVRAAGLVTCRQHPDTKSGVVFVTIEDESGSANVVVWKDVFKHYRRDLLGARLLGVEGVIETEGSVVHLIARRFADYTPLLARLLGRLEVASHDFH